MYTYTGIVTKVYDADTITVDINLGFGICKKGEKIRLADINAPEVRGVERESGLIARDALRAEILNKEIIIQTQKDKKGKYGRYIGTIYIKSLTTLTESENVDIPININKWLVNSGYAEYVDY